MLLSSANARGLALSACILMLGTSLAMPVRSVIRERREMGELRAQLAEQRSQISVLEARKVRLQDQAYLRTLVRSRLNYVYPGEIGFVVLDKETSTQLASVPGALVPNNGAAWYSKLWTSTRLADEPQKSDDPLVVSQTPKP